MPRPSSNKANRRQLRILFSAFRGGGAILLVVEVMAWVAALVAQGS